MWKKIEGYEIYDPKECKSTEGLAEDSEVIDYLIRAFDRLKYDSEGLDITASANAEFTQVWITQKANDFQAQTTFIKIREA